jgi:hypothetical protein
LWEAVDLSVSRAKRRSPRARGAAVQRVVSQVVGGQDVAVGGLFDRDVNAALMALPPDSGHGVVDYAAICSVAACRCS